MKDPVRTITDAAALLAAAKGYDGTSMQDVATAVGITKAGLYHYVPNKQALFESIVLSTLSDMTGAAMAAVSAQDDPAGKLTAFMVSHAVYFESNRDRYRASFFGWAGGDLSEFSAEQLAARKDYTKQLETILIAGKTAGAFKVVNIATLSRGILGMLNWMARWYDPDGPETAAAIAIGYAEIVLNGIDPD